jgi:hypothetical protein
VADETLPAPGAHRLPAALSICSVTVGVAAAVCLGLAAGGKPLLGSHDAVVLLWVVAAALSPAAVVCAFVGLHLAHRRGVATCRSGSWLGGGVGCLVMLPTWLLGLFFLLLLSGGPAH